jgi:hypothetical protein
MGAELLVGLPTGFRDVTSEVKKETLFPTVCASLGLANIRVVTNDKKNISATQVIIDLEEKDNGPVILLSGISNNAKPFSPTIIYVDPIGNGLQMTNTPAPETDNFFKKADLITKALRKEATNAYIQRVAVPVERGSLL